MNFSRKAITLAELIIAISLLGVIILAGTAFDTAIRQSFRHTDVQVQLLTELSPAMQHMTKHIMQGIGSVSSPGVDISLDNRIKVRLDLNPNPTPGDCSDDTWVFYRYQANEIEYCSNAGVVCSVPAGWGCPANEVIARRIFFNPPSSPPMFAYVDSNGDGLADNRDNVIAINITACQDPDGAPIACGDPGNPVVTLRTNVSLRAASVR